MNSHLAVSLCACICVCVSVCVIRERDSVLKCEMSELGIKQPRKRQEEEHRGATATEKRVNANLH